MDELAAFLGILKKRAEAYDEWIEKVKKALDAKGDDRLEFSDLKELADEATEKQYPDTDLLTGLVLTVEEAEKCQTVRDFSFFNQLFLFSDLVWPDTMIQFRKQMGS